ncbi:TerC family protein [Pararobbsia silviterrae]|uniref:TerC family protein n=1 Tax=Pararobbsia silviterrae TaxID=1792498 RepID=A0A494Y8I1_9BURK|nr:TerC family protein [Pararobbsia silviterrae]RKP58982.1 TerC family protein [Pararobbsia silviterrae]
MPEFIADIHWSAVIQIVVIDLLLGGDNAVVIALACRDLDPRQRVQGIVYGTIGAIVLRTVLVAFAVVLLDLPFLKMLGGVLLLYIGIRLLQPDDAERGEVAAADRLLSAIRTIIVADLVMSIDNVVAIAGAAENAPPHHRIYLVILGLLVSIPLVVGGSTLLLRLIERFPVIVLGGAGLLGWIAGGLIVDDPFIDRFDWLQSDLAAYLSSAVGAALVVGVGLAIKSARAKRGAAGI